MKSEFKLDENQYKKLKEINIVVFAMIRQFGYEVEEIFDNIKENIIAPFCLTQRINDLYLFSKKEYIETERSLSHAEIKDGIRYYNENDKNKIKDIVLNQKYILGKISKKMNKALMYNGQKEMRKIRGRIQRRLKKLQKELEEILQLEQ